MSTRTGTQPQAKPARIRAREIHGNVIVTPDTLTAWYVLSPQRWSFTTDAQREQLIVAFAQRLIGLAGHRCHLRVTTRPYPAKVWAEQLHANTPNPLGGSNGEAWTEHLHAAQRALHRSTLSDKEVYFGVDLKTRGRFDRLVSAGRKNGAAEEITKQSGNLQRIADVVAGPGMGGRPATTEELEWLMHRSIRLGLPAPARLSPADSEEPWTPEDMHVFTEGVDYEYKPFGPDVKITADYKGQEVTRHVAVLTVGRMGLLTVPFQAGRNPWLQHLDREGFPVEIASTFDVQAGTDAGKATEKKRMELDDQENHWAEHKLRVPKALLRKIEHARRIEDETSDGDPLQAARAYGWHRIAVSAETPEELERRITAVTDSYAGQRIAIHRPRTIVDADAQFPLYLEFIPGEKVSTAAYRRDLKALHVAAGLPHVASSIGDRRGAYYGYTVATNRRAFMFDPHYAMEVQEKAGLVPIIGEQGCGKSGLIGKLTYEEVAGGVVTTVLDPGGPLAALTRIPRFANRARHVDIVSGDDGVLNTYSVIADPPRHLYDDDTEWQEAVQDARQDRKMLTLDVATTLLPYRVATMERTPLVLNKAIRMVEPERTASMYDVVEKLDWLAHNDREEFATHAEALGGYLRDMAEMPQSRLFFPNNVHDLPEYDDLLLVLTMHGIQLPAKDQPRETWSTREQMSVPLLNLAAHYATRRVYGLPRSERKCVPLDEVGLMAEWGSGRTLFNQFGRNSRKWNIAVPLGSQNPADTLSMNIANLFSTSFVGRIEDEETAAEALRLLRVKPGAGYESTVSNLSPQVTLGDGSTRRGAREFIVKDVFGNVEKVKIDLSHQPDLLEALSEGTIRQERGAAA